MFKIIPFNGNASTYNWFSKRKRETFGNITTRPDHIATQLNVDLTKTEEFWQTDDGLESFNEMT